MTEIFNEPVVTGFMNLDELITKYAPAHSESWDDWWNHPSHSTVEGGRVINTLVEELLNDGGFQEPVILCEADSYTDEDNGIVTHFPASIGNGMHRLKSHHFTGIKNVFVQYGYDSSMDDEPILQATFNLVDENVDGMENFDADDYLWDALSWRHWDGENTAWLKIDFASSSCEDHKVFLVGGAPDYISAVSVKKYLEEKFGDRITNVEVNWMTFDYEADTETVVPDYTQVDFIHSPNS